MRNEPYPHAPTDPDLGCSDGEQISLFGSTTPPFAAFVPPGGADTRAAHDPAPARNVAQQSGIAAHGPATTSTMVAGATTDAGASREQSAPEIVAPGTGTIYFIQAGVALAPIKIGHTDGDPETRRKTLQAANPERLYIIATIPGDRSRERRLHKRFAAGRLEGEWFDPLTPGLQDFLSDAIHFEGFEDDRESPASIEVLTS